MKAIYPIPVERKSSIRKGPILRVATTGRTLKTVVKKKPIVLRIKRIIISNE